MSRISKKEIAGKLILIGRTVFLLINFVESSLSGTKSTANPRETTRTAQSNFQMVKNGRSPWGIQFK
ncbi:MAG: hypothetical protein RBG13Loki_1412 [Promethearchaeota archaeon CR_4]|nr:MAG: hypothetical protein RBG13Loki_1412 [Candidatus Lokiarchaeota archaeon CR_4]